MYTHVKVLAVLFIIVGALGIIGAIASSLLLSALAGMVGASGGHDAAIGGTFLGLTGVILGIVLVVMAVPSIICGWGLLRLRPWARVLGIVLSAISLIRFPFFTLLGIYGLWVLFKKDTEALFTGGIISSPPLPPSSPA
jgi:hypothetical protein